MTETNTETAPESLIESNTSTEDTSTEDNSTEDTSTESEGSSSWHGGNEVLQNFDSLEAVADAIKNIPMVPKADEYQLPDGLPYQGFGEMANKANLSQGQVNEVLDYYAGISVAAQESFTQAQENQLEAVFAKWGEQKDSKLALANQVLREFDKDKSATNFLLESGNGRNPFVLQFLSDIGSVLAEDGYLRSTAQPEPQSKAREDVLFDS